MSHPTHILVIRFSAMGDVAMTVPVLRALTQQYPKLKITVVTKAFFKPIFESIPNVEVYTADLKGKHKGILGLYKLSQALKALNFDAVADLHNVLRSNILKFFFFGKQMVQIDKGRIEKKALTTGKMFKPLKTTHLRYAEVFKKIGYPIDLTTPNFPNKAKLNDDLKRFVVNNEHDTIGIAPFAAHKGKMYPLKKMEVVIEQLSKDFNIILFGGGSQEIQILDTLDAKYEAVKSAAGKLNLEEELALMSNLDLMLSMDSGNGHLAAMLGVKVISIWGVTHPYAGFAPFHQPDDYTLVADKTQFPLVPTSIYGNKYPEGYENAAGSIAVETIVEKVKQVLES